VWDCYFQKVSIGLYFLQVTVVVSFQIVPTSEHSIISTFVELQIVKVLSFSNLKLLVQPFLGPLFYGVLQACTFRGPVHDIQAIDWLAVKDQLD
jgi:hypothetical protein